MNPFANPEFLDRLRQTQVLGPFPEIDGELYVPIPYDAVAYACSDNGPPKWYALEPRPLGFGEGTNLPHESIWPVAVPVNEKAVTKYQFWSEGSIRRWLIGRPDQAFQPRCTEGFPKEERVHIGMEHALGRAADQMLFSTQGLVIPDVGTNSFGQCSLVALVRTPDDEIQALLGDVDVLQTFGGERRLSRFRSSLASNELRCSDAARELLSKSTGFRMFLATPAIFSGGWLPGWLDPVSLEGTPPTVESNLRLKLRGACVQRWRAVSGWDLEQRTEKPVRRLVPAGSVYFFHKVEGSGEELVDAWMEPVSDEDKDRRDGYGVALWGTWECDFTKGGLTE